MSDQTTWQSTFSSKLTSSAINKDVDFSSDDSTAPSNLVYQEFLSALAKCFLVILVGYLAARLRLLNEQEANGLEIFVRQFALPSLIFLTLASVELNSINWGIIKCFAATKIIIFIAVLLVTITVSKPFHIGQAGLYSIFCTQSNDLCLGLPIIDSLYQNYHPEFSHYLYLLAAVQYLLLNPFGFFLMELQRRGYQQGLLDKSLRNMIGALIQCTFLNPIIVMTFLGILANVCWNHQVPMMLRNFLDVLGVAFPATALFSLGYSLVANSGSLIGARLVIPSLLIITKILFLPLLNRFIMHIYVDANQLLEREVYENFAFLYGTIPTAPTVYIFATQFSMETDVVATGMVASTFLSAPLMFLSGTMSTVNEFSSSYLQADLTKAVTYSSILGTFCSLWVLVVFIRAKVTCSLTHGLTVYIVAFQLLAALGGIFTSITGLHSKFVVCIQHFASVVGILSSHLWTALLAITIAILYMKSLCFTIYIRKYTRMFGFVMTLMISLIIAVILRKDLNTKENTIDLLFHGADTNVCVAILVICIFSITLSFIMQQWYFSNNQHKSYSSNSENSGTESSATDSLMDLESLMQNCTSNEQEEISDIEELQYPSCVDDSFPTEAQPFPTFCEADSKCLSKNRNLCAGVVKKYHLHLQKSREQSIIFELYEDRHQIRKHLILVILLLISMIISFVINMWKLLLKEKSSIYIELEFLNATLCHGLGIISFAVFGFDRNLVLNPCMWWLWHLRHGSGTLVLPEMKRLPLKTRQICTIFLNYHAKNCVHEIAKDKNIGTRRYSKVFCGKDLVDWLLKVGLSHSRIEAEEYGNHLLLGRVISHIKKKYYFQDLPHLYMFTIPR